MGASNETAANIPSVTESESAGPLADLFNGAVIELNATDTMGASDSNMVAERNTERGCKEKRSCLCISTSTARPKQSTNSGTEITDGATSQLESI